MSKQTIYLLVEPADAIPVWFARIIDGLRNSCAKNRYGLHQLGAVNELDAIGDSPSAVLVICSQNNWTQHVIRELKARNIMTILLGTTPDRLDYKVSGVMIDRRIFIEITMDYLLSCGRDRMALVGVNRNAGNDNIKIDAFIASATAIGVSATQSDIYCIDTDIANSVAHFLDNAQRYNSVICSNDYVAALLLAQAKNRGVRIPEDLYVVGLGNTLIGRYTEPTLTTSAYSEFIEVGQQAVNLWRIITDNPSVSNILITVGTEIIPRGSTAFSEPPGPLTPLPISSIPQIRIGARSETLRNLENCLRGCDALDTQILRCLLRGQSNEQIETSLFLAHSSLYYRLKKLYQLANVSCRAELESLFQYYLPNFQNAPD